MRVDSGTIPLPVRNIGDATRPLRTTDAQPAPPLAERVGEAGGTDAGSFADLLRDALRRVNESQVAADLAVEQVATGEADDLHDAIIAVETADLALRLTAQVTQRAVEAYREISRMQL